MEYENLNIKFTNEAADNDYDALLSNESFCIIECSMSWNDNEIFNSRFNMLDIESAALVKQYLTDREHISAGSSVKIWFD